jgi:hypothetical protein
MKRPILLLLGCVACSREPTERYGFIARLGSDTIALERVTRRGNTLTSDEVDRFPRVRRRHTEITLAPDGGVERLVMDIETPSEPENQRQRHIVADVTDDSVIMTKRDGAENKRWTFGTGGATMMAHIPQMYSLYEIYFAAGLRRMATPVPGDTVVLKQFYIDREFDRFSLHRGVVHKRPNRKAEIRHDWLSGTGEATVDSAMRLLTYSGARTTYKVEVERLSEPPDVQTIGAQFVATESKAGGVRSLSVRDTARATIGSATFTIDYGRPRVRGRKLLGDVIPFGYVWRTGANAATQLTTSAAITLAGITVPAGSYTLWTVPRTDGSVELIVNKQTGQWGTSYDSRQNLAAAPLQTETLTSPVEQFTISIVGIDDRRGALTMEWGPHKWTAPIVVEAK